MATNLPAETLYKFITDDFESAWNSMAGRSKPLPGGGNFMFARQAMVLLEWAARVCRADTTGAALKRLSHELNGINPRYFRELPAAFPVRVSEKDFTLPSLGLNADRELLRLVFDLVRNGQAHQYQQINVDLADGTELQVSLSGVDRGLFLGSRSGPPERHLRVEPINADVIALRVFTDVLYLDIRQAIKRAGLPTGGLQLVPLKRDQYPFTSAELLKALQHP